MKSRSAHNEFTPFVVLILEGVAAIVADESAVSAAVSFVNGDELSAACIYSNQGVVAAGPLPVEAVAAVTTVGRYRVPCWSVLSKVCVLSSSRVQSHMVSLPRRRPWM